MAHDNTDQVAAGLLTRKALAEALGVNAMSIPRWEVEGLPVASRGGRGRPSYYRLPDVIRWRIERELQARGADPEGISPAIEKGLLDRRRRETVELELAVRRGELVEAKDVATLWTSIVTAARERLLSLPGAAAQLGIVDDDGEGRLIELVDEALLELSRGGQQ